MSLDVIFFWLTILAFCELSLAASMASLLGSAGVLILLVCGWLVRLDLDLLAFLLAATYSSVLVCLSLVQTNLEGYPGLSALPRSRHILFSSDLLFIIVLGTINVVSSTTRDVSMGGVDFYQNENDWLEQVVGVFHLFFYKTATFEAILLNLFLLLALIASLSILTFISVNSGGYGSSSLRGSSRIRVIRAFRRQVRRKNSSQIRSAKR